MRARLPGLAGGLRACMREIGLETRELRWIALAQSLLACALTGLALLLMVLPSTRTFGVWGLWAAAGAWAGWVNFLLLVRKGTRMTRSIAAQGEGATAPTLAVTAGIMLKLFITAGLFVALVVWADAPLGALLVGFTLNVAAMIVAGLLSLWQG